MGYKLFEKLAIINKYGEELYSFGNSEKIKTTDSGLLASFIITLQTMSEEDQEPISSIKLQNSVIYIMTYTEFTIVLILESYISDSLLDYVFKELSSIIVYQYNKIVNRENFPNLDQKIKNITSIIDYDGNLNSESPITTSNSFSKRIALVGLANAGKTSLKNKFFHFLEKKQSDNIKPTIGIEISKNKINYVQEEIIIFDFGGQKVYRTGYISNPVNFSNFSAIIFVIDIQQPDLFLEAKSYFESLLKVIEKNKPDNPIISIFLHKFDTRNELLLENVNNFLEIFKSHLKKYSYYYTSIYDNSSATSFFNVIFLSLSDIMVKFILERLLIDKLQDSLLNKDKIAELKSKNNELLFFMGLMEGTEVSKEFQDLWFKSYQGMYNPTTREIISKELVFINDKKKITIEIENWEEIDISHEISDPIITGALKGLFNTLFLHSPIELNHKDNKSIWSIEY